MCLRRLSEFGTDVATPSGALRHRHLAPKYCRAKAICALAAWLQPLGRVHHPRHLRISLAAHSCAAATTALDANSVSRVAIRQRVEGQLECDGQQPDSVTLSITVQQLTNLGAGEFAARPALTFVGNVSGTWSTHLQQPYFHIAAACPTSRPRRWDPTD